MINVAIIGATGYTGEELVRILAGHRDVKLKALSAIVDKPRKISEIFPALEYLWSLPPNFWPAVKR